MVAKGRLTSGAPGYPVGMSPDDELMLIFGILHLVALVLGVVLFVMFLSSDARSDRNPPDDDDSGGGNDRLGDRPKTSPPGGIPLPDAEPSPVRLRGYGRLADAHRRERRRTVEPAQPGRRRVAI
jgi:hypothetical protein